MVLIYCCIQFTFLVVFSHPKISSLTHIIQWLGIATMPCSFLICPESKFIDRYLSTLQDKRSRVASWAIWVVPWSSTLWYCPALRVWFGIWANDFIRHRPWQHQRRYSFPEIPRKGWSLNIQNKWLGERNLLSYCPSNLVGVW